MSESFESTESLILDELCTISSLLRDILDKLSEDEVPEGEEGEVK